MSETTPGPWRVIEAGPARFRIRGNVGPIEVDVAEVYGGPGDARLVASAPDLLEALKAARAKLQIEVGGAREYKGGMPTQVLFPLIDAAIAKATP